MNSLIRNQNKVLRYGYDTRFPSKSTNYLATSTHTPMATALRYGSTAKTTSLVGNVAALSRQHIVYRIPRPLATPLASLAGYNNDPNAGQLLHLQREHNHWMRRQLHLSRRLYENTPSSKVEATVQTMKNKQKEKVEEIMKEAASAGSSDSSVAAPETKAAAKTPEAPVKKSLQTRIWEEIVHYYHGFKLLFIDINICRKLLWRVLNGKQLTRRESNLLVRTTSDVFRLIPFSVFVIVPFMELLLPVFIKFFPGMLPSTFRTDAEREDTLRKSLQVKLEMAKFLQKTLDEMAVQHKEHKSEEAKQFASFFERIKDPNEYVGKDEIIKYAKRFEDEITLDSLSREQLSALCRLLELNTMGTTPMLRFLLRVRLRSLSADDRVIAREGVNALDLFELQQACKARGMRAYGLTAERLRFQLQEWIDLSLNEKVPQILLLLSRAMLISDESTTTDKLKETIRVLPDAVAAQTKASIGEREGKIDNKTKIDIIKEEERKIKEEREEEREELKTKAEILHDKATFTDTAAAHLPFGSAGDKMAHSTPAAAKVKEVASEPADEKGITSQDVELLSKALKSLSSEKKTMAVEKETIKDLKEELEDYKEDVAELHEVRNVVKEPVRESIAAKMLFKKVNSMIGQLDTVLADLEKKNQKLKTGSEAEVPGEVAKDDVVKIDELLQTLQKLKETTDESRLKTIENVLDKLDTDKDGVISVEEVLKVIEALARDKVQLSEKQIEELITLLDKEQVIEAEEKIEKAMAKSIKEAQKITTTKELEESQRKAEAAIANEELKDTAPVLRDSAKDLNAADKKHNLQTETPKTLSSDAASPLLEAAEKQKEKLIPKADISAAIPPVTQATIPKDKML